MPVPSREPPVPSGERMVWISQEDGWQRATIFDGASLAPGHRIEGPALIEEHTTTVLIGAADVLAVDATGYFRIALAPGD